MEKSKLDLEMIMNEKAQAAIFRSGAQYFTEGEMPTKYFYNLIKYKAGAKNMHSIILENGQEVSDQKIILQEQYKFFKSLYTASECTEFDFVNDSDIRLSEDSKAKLEGKILMHELTAALKNMKRNKSPGCDGLPTEFYLCFWNRIKFQLLEAINESYDKHELFPSALKGIISLIPKKGKDLRFIKNMRPISLLNTDYKLIEKTLANRLKPALSELMNEDQKGFLQQRSISANIRRILDIITIADQEDFPGVIVSIDFEKCFDKIEIPALMKSLSYFNFGESFKKWTSLLYSKPQATVINNGYFTPLLIFKGGFDRGDPTQHIISCS